ncbi:acetyl-CoA acetyltransferase family protein [Bradyrhizobium sp. LB7.1]
MEMLNHHCGVTRDARGVVHVAICNAGSLNILGSPVTDAVREGLQKLATDRSIRVMVLRGQSEKSMIGGADIKEMVKLDQASAEAFISRLRDLCEAVRAFPAPVIARMPGWCLGGGLEVAAACDFRIAAHDAHFGMPEVRVGIPSVIHAALLPRLIGWARARWLVMTAENIDAPTALAWGLVDKVAPEGGLDAAVEQLVQALLECGPEALRSQKALLRQWEELPLTESVNLSVISVRPIVPDRRADAADAGVRQPEAVGLPHSLLPSNEQISSEPRQFLMLDAVAFFAPHHMMVIILPTIAGSPAMAETADPVVIVSAVRSPLGRFMGELSPLPAHKLGSHVIAAALERAKLAPEKVDEVFMGCVLPAGQGQAPARQAARAAGLPDATGATTVNKVCGSGMKATMLAHDIIRAGSAEIVVSGGMESMSNAPYLLAKARGGYRAGHDRIIDHMMMDGLEDAYETGRSMGDFGEATAEAYQFTRKDQDAYAMETLSCARKAVEGGAFKAEIAPITLSEKAGLRIVANDEHPLKVDPAKIPGLKPAFRANGTITPAASSANADGAAALVLTTRSLADRNGLPALAEIKGHATHSQEPQWFTTAPIPAIRKLLDKVGWSAGDVDLFEINEAFAVVAMAAQRDLGIPREKLNINGGACALGHPIGATGARLIVTLLHALEAKNLKRGVAALCIGGGEATAIAVERLTH